MCNEKPECQVHFQIVEQICIGFSICPLVDYLQTQGVFDRNLQKIYHTKLSCLSSN